MKGEMVMVLASQDLVAGLDDQIVLLIPQPAAFVVHHGRRLFEQGVGDYHLPGDEIVADAEMLQGTLGLGPQSRSAGTFTSPRLSVSIRYSLMAAPCLIAVYFFRPVDR